MPNSNVLRPTKTTTYTPPTVYSGAENAVTSNAFKSLLTKIRSRLIVVEKLPVGLVDMAGPFVIESAKRFFSEKGFLPGEPVITEIWRNFVASFRNEKQARDIEQAAQQASTANENQRRRFENAFKFLQNQIKNRIGNIQSMAGFAILLPVASVLNVALRAKGVTPPKKIAQKAILFIAEYGQDFPNALPPQKLAEIQTYARENGLYEKFDLDGDNIYFLDPVTISLIISAIIAIISSILESKRNGERLTPAQEKIAEAALKAEEEYNRQVERQQSFIIGDFLNQNFIWIAIAVVAYLFFKGN